jgi:hypothetical protein
MTTVFVSNSQPLLSSNTYDLQIISNAKVELSSDAKTWITCHYDSQKERYILPQTEFPIREGYTYYIRAKASGFEGSVSSSCTVPFYRDIDLKISTKTIEDDGEIRMESTFSWNDYPGESNFYSFCGYRIFDYIDPYEDVYKAMYADYLYDDTSNVYVFSDEGKDGSIITVKSSYYLNYVEDETQDTLLLNVIQMDKENYLYEKSWNNYSSYDDLFGMVEPTLLYNNIENGYGLFSAFVFKTYLYNLKTQKLEAYYLP